MVICLISILRAGAPVPFNLMDSALADDFIQTKKVIQISTR